MKNLMKQLDRERANLRERVVVSLDDVHPGDTIYLSTVADATPYSVLDVGKPFILIESLESHFANLYRPSIIYKDI